MEEILYSVGARALNRAWRLSGLSFCGDMKDPSGPLWPAVGSCLGSGLGSVISRSLFQLLREENTKHTNKTQQTDKKKKKKKKKKKTNQKTPNPIKNNNNNNNKKNNPENHTTFSESFSAVMASDLWVLVDSGTMSEEAVREACCYSIRIPYYSAFYFRGFGLLFCGLVTPAGCITFTLQLTKL